VNMKTPGKFAGAGQSLSRLEIATQDTEDDLSD